MSLRDRPILFGDFVGMTAHSLFRATTTNCFLRVCIPTFFAAVLKVFLPLTTSAISGTANSNKSTPTRFAAGTICLGKNVIAVLALTCGSAPNPHPRCRPTPL